MSDSTSTAPDRTSSELKEAALSGGWDVPEGRPGNVIAQLRNRASMAARSARIYFIWLTIVVVCGLGYFLLRPLVETYADGGRQAQEDNLSFIGAQLKTLDEQRDKIRGSLERSLALTGKVLDTGMREAPIRLIKTTNENVFALGESGNLVRLERDGSWKPVGEDEDQRQHMRATNLGNRIFTLSRDTENSNNRHQIHGRLIETDGTVILDQPLGVANVRAPLVVRAQFGARAIVQTGRTEAWVIDGAAETMTPIPFRISRFYDLGDGIVAIIPRSLRQRETVHVLDLSASTQDVIKITGIPLLPREARRREVIAAYGRLEDGTLTVMTSGGRLLVASRPDFRSSDLSWTATRIFDPPAVRETGATRRVPRNQPRYLEWAKDSQGRYTYFVASQYSLYRSSDLENWQLEDQELRLRFPRFSKDAANNLFLVASVIGSSRPLRFDAETGAWIEDFGQGSLRGSPLMLENRELAFPTTRGFIVTSDVVRQGWQRAYLSTSQLSIPQQIISLRSKGHYLVRTQDEVMLVSDNLQRKVAEIENASPLDETGQEETALLNFWRSRDLTGIRDQGDLAPVDSTLSALKSQRLYLSESKARSEDWLAFYENFDFTSDPGLHGFLSFMRVCNDQATVGFKDFQTLPDARDANTSEAFVENCLEAFQKLKSQDQTPWLTALQDRAPQAILLLFLLATLGGLYRYNLRLFGFHHSRADILELVVSQKTGNKTALTKADIENIQILSEALAAEKVEFARSNTPTEQAVALARAVSNRS